MLEGFTSKRIMSLPAALTIDGVDIRYGILRPGPEGGIFRTYFCSAFRKALFSYKKQLLPRFDFWKFNSSRTRIIIADFDEKPEDFERWSDFRSYLAYTYPQALPLESPSGKAKLLFKVSLPEGIEIDHYIAADTLRLLLSEEHYDLCDKNSTAFHVLFANCSMYTILTEQVNDLVPFPAVLDSVKSGSEKAPWTWIPTDLPLPQLQELRSELSEVQFFVIHFIASWARKALDSSLQVPQTYLAEQSRLLHSKGLLSESFSQVEIHYALQDLIQLGYLTCVDHSYTVHKKAKRYKVLSKVHSLLLGLLVLLVDKKRQLLSGSMSHLIVLPPGSPPASDNSSAPIRFPNKEELVFRTTLPEWMRMGWIEEGSWNRSLWTATNFFQTFESYMRWVMSIPGHQLKTRLKQAKNAWESHAARLSLDTPAEGLI